MPLDQCEIPDGGLLRSSLRSYFAALMRCTVYIDVKISSQIALVLSICKLRTRGNGPGVIGAFGERDNHRTGLTRSAFMNVRSRRVHPRDRDIAAH